MRLRSVLVSLFALSASCLSAMALTVGSCKADKHPYPSITAAITAAQNGEVIEVCPGRYAEQLIIKKSLTIRGIGTFTLANPSGGLLSIAATGNGVGYIFAPVFVNVPGGEVKISYMQTGGGDLAFPAGNPVPASALCEDGVIEGAFGGSYVGVYSLDGNVYLDHVSTGFDLSPLAGGTPDSPARSPNCGDGIVFKNGSGIVTHSVVAFGFRGISGAQRVEHTTISGGGTHSIGVAGGDVIESTLTGPGYSLVDSTGISSARSQGNVIQNFVVGIKGGTARHNTLLNNEVAISGAGDLTENLVVASPTYPNPFCVTGAICTDQIPTSDMPSHLPTTGIDLACADGTVTRDNSIVGVGIAFANVDPHRSIPRTNLVANVSVTSTVCAQ